MYYKYKHKSKTYNNIIQYFVIELNLLIVYDCTTTVNKLL